MITADLARIVALVVALALIGCCRGRVFGAVIGMRWLAPREPPAPGWVWQ